MSKEEESLKHRIALSLLPGIGPVTARLLISYCGDAEEIFRMKKNRLERIPGIGPDKAGIILSANVMQRAEEEIDFLRRNSIKTYFYLDKDYPSRLKNCTDAPLLLYFKGECDLNASRIVNIIGTRRNTSYGKEVTEKLVEELKRYETVVVSGLAYGIDIIAHRAAIINEVPTVAVTAHGLDRIYPSVHSSSADRMLKQGGILTEYPSGTNPDRENFPARNRIVAGISDATIIIESAVKGGALITADLANSYNRDVFAFPGRVHDAYSQGCHHLIRENKAMLVTSAADIARAMNWDIEEAEKEKKIRKQLALFVELNEDERKLAEILKEGGTLSVDILAVRSEMPVSRVSSLLLNLEFSGILRSLPGKMYELT